MIIKFNPYLFPVEKTAPQRMIWNAASFYTSNEMMQKDEKLKMYRGNPQRNSIFQIKNVSKLESRWRSKKINFGIHGASKASAIVDESSIYVGSDTSWFYSFDKLTGQINWQFYLGESSRGIHSTAALDQDYVYVGSYRGAVYKIKKMTGELQWMRILGDTVGASPLIDSNSILYNVETYKPDGFLVKLDKKNGDIVWQSDFLGEQSHSSPALTNDGKTFAIGVNNSTIQGFDYATGERRWNKKVQGPLKSTGWADEDFGYLSGWGKEIIKFNIHTGGMVWNAALQSKSQVSPAFSKKYNVVLIADAEGTNYGINATDGQLIWKWQKKKFLQMSSPVIVQHNAQEYFLFQCQQEVLCLINPLDGSISKSWPINGTFTGSPEIDSNMLYLAYNNGEVEAFEFK